MEIWDYAELGYQENRSADLLAQSLEDEGFSIKKNLAGIPTAFIAEFKNGGPIIGILGEFDALPGLAQSNSHLKKSLIMILVLVMHVDIISLEQLRLGQQQLLKIG